MVIGPVCHWLTGPIALLKREKHLSSSAKIAVARPLWMDVPSAEAPAFAGMTGFRRLRLVELVSPRA